MRVPFSDSRLRIARAVKHGQAIGKTWDSLILARDKQPSPLIVRRGTRDYVATVKIQTQPENDIALLAGEFFYQLRAALDAAAYQSLVLQERIDPPKNQNRVEFPIYEYESLFEKCPLMQSSLPTELKTWIRSLQPFAQHTVTDLGARELARRLKVLHDCARKDRHRRLHVVMATITNMETAIVHSPNVTISNLRALPINFLDGDSDFLAFDADVSDELPTIIRLMTGITIELGIAEIPGFQGNGLMQELERIMLAARHIVDVFEDGHRT